MRSLFRSALAPSTVQAYRRTLAEFSSFLGYSNINLVLKPFTQLDIVRYIASLFNGGLSHPSILSRLSAITHWMRMKNWPLTTQSHAVTQAMRGVRTLSSKPSRDKSPITPNVLKRLCFVVGSISLSSDDVIRLRAMFSLAFHAFLRVGELCGSCHALQLADVRSQDAHLVIRFPTYKFSLGRCPVIFIPARPGPICPVRLLRNYPQIRGMVPGPLFLDKIGVPFTIQKFRTQLALVVQAAGYQSWGITPHSFRVGAATSAAAISIPEETIQRMGRWSSRALFLYIKFQINRV